MRSRRKRHSTSSASSSGARQPEDAGRVAPARRPLLDAVADGLAGSATRRRLRRSPTLRVWLTARPMRRWPSRSGCRPSRQSRTSLALPSRLSTPTWRPTSTASLWSSARSPSRRSGATGPSACTAPIRRSGRGRCSGGTSRAWCSATATRTSSRTARVWNSWRRWALSGR